jgi:hypothetical protein
MNKSIIEVKPWGNDMNEEEYLRDRLQHQLEWYSKKSRYNKKWYKRLRLTEIVSASLIPFLSGMGERIPYSPWIIGGLGALIAVAAAASALFKFHENWIQYRTTAEQLKHEKFMYLTGINPYNGDDKFSLMVERVESLISKENTVWAQSTKKQDPATNKSL